MSKKLISVAEHVQHIQTLTNDLPSQYAQKIEELCSTILSVTAMAEQINIVSVNVDDLQEGVNEVNGHKIIVENGTVRIG